MPVPPPEALGLIVKVHAGVRYVLGVEPTQEVAG
jgi:hypothetical protein